MGPTPSRDLHDLIASLEHDPAVVYALDPQLRIVACNAAWDRSAIENGGQGLERRRQAGRVLMDVIPQVLKAFFAEGFARVFSYGETFEHSCECSSPDHYRVYRMLAQPTPGGSGCLVANSRLVERPHGPDRAALAADASAYADESGHYTMCSRRRTRLAGSEGAWHWVPAYAGSAPKRSATGSAPSADASTPCGTPSDPPDASLPCAVLVQGRFKLRGALATGAGSPEFQ